MLLKKFLILIISIVFLVGCATPPQVKQLSIKQNEYFDIAIKAVSIQAEALILATDTLVKQSKQRISSIEKTDRKSFELLMQNSAQSPADSKEIANRITATAAKAEQSRQRLDRDFELIKQKTSELRLYLEKMKEINITLDAYIQSEKAGETVVKDIMNEPTVNALLNSVTDLTPKIQNYTSAINSLLNNK